MRPQTTQALSQDLNEPPPPSNHEASHVVTVLATDLDRAQRDKMAPPPKKAWQNAT